MKTPSKVLLVISLTGFVLGLSNLGPPMFSGLARAIGAIFFILVYITRVFELIEAESREGVRQAATQSRPAKDEARVEPTHEGAALHGAR
jgi:hypothetical protein